jgi:hypothetical protein
MIPDITVQMWEEHFKDLWKADPNTEPEDV